MTLQIYEIDYSVSPGGINSFEIYDESGEFIIDFDSLIQAHNWCNSQAENYTVHLLSSYHREFDEDLLEAPALAGRE
jgi:hypothetical protein